MHVLDQLQRYVDGELTPSQAQAVRDHCTACEQCNRALEELGRVVDLLRVDEAEAPLSPMWPAVRKGDRDAVRLDWRLVVGSSMAAVAGILLAFFLGTVNPVTPRAATGDAWADLGATVAGGSEAGLSNLYLDSREGANTP